MNGGSNPLFWDEYIVSIKFFFTSSIHNGILKQAPKYLATWLWIPSGTNSPPAEASTQGLKCKTNTITIFDASDVIYDYVLHIVNFAIL
jgi:hypothetical protein